MALTLRTTKGSPLTAAEMDANLTYLESVGTKSGSIDFSSGSVYVSNATKVQLGSTISVTDNGSGTVTLNVVGSLGSGGGVAGSAGSSGTSGASGTNGTSGVSGTSGTSGLSGDKFSTTSSDSRTITNAGSMSFTIGTGLKWSVGQQMLIAYDANNTMTGTVTSYNSGTGALSVTLSASTGSGTYSSWAINILGAPGQAGTNGSSGTSGINGSSGTSGSTGTSGSSGSSGVSGSSGSSGVTGTSGTSGVNGSSGSSGITGTSGSSGTSGVTGTSGSSGSSGVSGIQFPYTGSAIISGSTKITGSFSVTGSVDLYGATTFNRNVTINNNSLVYFGYNVMYEEATTSNLVLQTAYSQNLRLISAGGIKVSASLDINNGLTSSLAEGYTWVGGPGNRTVLVATSSLGSGGGATNSGIFLKTGSIYATTNNLQITGSVDITGPITASLPQGYIWVGNNLGKSVLLATSSLSITSASFATTASFGTISVQQASQTAIQRVSRVVFSGAGVADDGNGQVTVSISGGGGGTLNFVTGSTTYSSVSQVNVGGNLTISQPAPNQVTLNVASAASGTSGTSGTSGKDGTNGTGTPGNPGTSGSSGTSGLDGSMGTNGTSGTSGSSGTSGVNGTNGTSGISGSSGSSGRDGNGSAGSSGTSVTLRVRDTGITAISNLSDITFSGSFSLAASGSGGAVISISNVNVAGAPTGTVSGSYQIGEYGGALTSSINTFTANQIFSGSLIRRWLVTKNGSTDFVFTANNPIDGSGNDINIFANVGDTLIFEVTSSGQPFWIKTTSTTGTNNGVTGVSNNGTQQGIVQYIATGSSETTIFYVSENTLNMGGAIVIRNSQGSQTKIAGGDLKVTGSINVEGGINVTGSMYVNGVSVLGGGGGASGIFIATGSFYNTTNNVGITGSLLVDGPITASAVSITTAGSPEIYSANNLYLNAGNVVQISSSSLRLASFTSTQTASFTPQSGDMYYNTTTNKFMGYLSNSWVAFPSSSATPVTLSGTKANSLLTYTDSATATAQASMSFDSTAGVLDVSGSVYVSSMMKLKPLDPLPLSGLQMGMLAVSSSGHLFFYTGGIWAQIV